MNDFINMILAAGKRNFDFSWVVPLILFAVYAFSAIGKFLQQRKEKQLEEESPQQIKPRFKPLDNGQQKPASLTPEQRRAQRLPYAPRQSQQPKPAALRQVQPVRQLSPESVKETLAPVLQPVKPTVQRMTPRSMPIQPTVRKRTHAVKAGTATAVKRQPQPVKARQRIAKPKPHTTAKPAAKQSRLAELLTDKNDLRRGIIYSEIFGKPIALRDQL